MTLPEENRRSESGGGSGIFRALSPQAAREFNEIGIQVSLPKGAVVFRKDDPAVTVIAIRSGQVKLSRTSRGGKTTIVRIATAGDLLGLGAALCGIEYEVTAETVEPVALENIRRDQLLEFLRRHTEAIVDAARNLSEEYKSEFFDACYCRPTGSAAGKLASLLLERAQSTCRARSKANLCFRMVLTHEDLASLTGTSRETVTRTLSRFQRDKMILVEGAMITILAPECLQTLARGESG